MASCHVTAVMYLFTVQEIKEKEQKIKGQIKLREIDETKIKQK